MMGMFQGAEFNQMSMGMRRQTIGNTIYNHVEKLVGSHAPKVTGMMLELPMAELNLSIREWEMFETKVMSAMEIISRNEQE